VPGHEVAQRERELRADRRGGQRAIMTVDTAWLTRPGVTLSAAAKRCCCWKARLAPSTRVAAQSSAKLDCTIAQATTSAATAASDALATNAARGRCAP